MATPFCISTFSTLTLLLWRRYGNLARNYYYLFIITLCWILFCAFSYLILGYVCNVAVADSKGFLVDGWYQWLIQVNMLKDC